MPLPRFIAGEVLSAVKLNQMVGVLNQSQNNMLSVGNPFEQVEANGTNAVVVYWSWMFRYNPQHRYYKLRYTWSGRAATAFASGGIKGTAGWTDPAGGATGVFNRTIDLSTLGLQPGKMYEYEIRADRKTSTFFRVDFLFMTNNSSFVPTIIG